MLMAVEMYGNWGKEAQSTISSSHQFFFLHKSRVISDICGKLNLFVVRSKSRAIQARDSLRRDRLVVVQLFFLLYVLCIPM